MLNSHLVNGPSSCWQNMGLSREEGKVMACVVGSTRVLDRWRLWVFNGTSLMGILVPMPRLSAQCSARLLDSWCSPNEPYALAHVLGKCPVVDNNDCDGKARPLGLQMMTYGLGRFTEKIFDRDGNFVGAFMFGAFPAVLE